MANKTHLALAELQNKYLQDIKIFTQNIDNLFEKVYYERATNTIDKIIQDIKK